MMLQDWKILLAGLEDVQLSPSPAPGPDLTAQGFPSVGVQFPRDEELSQGACPVAPLPSRKDIFPKNPGLLVPLAALAQETHPSLGRKWAGLGNSHQITQRVLGRGSPR